MHDAYRYRHRLILQPLLRSRQRRFWQVRTRLSRHGQSSLASLHGILNAVLMQFRTRGLLSLVADADNQGNISISASASVPEAVTLRWTDVFRRSTQSMRATYERVFRQHAWRGSSGETYAAVSVNGTSCAGPNKRRTTRREYAH